MTASRAGRAHVRPPAGAVRRELASMGRYPRKRLGQHFLTDTGVGQRIVDLAHLHGTERVVEIGSGLGALSDVLVGRSRELWLIEIDADFAARLSAQYADRRHVHVVQANVLKVDWALCWAPANPPSW